MKVLVYGAGGGCWLPRTIGQVDLSQRRDVGVFRRPDRSHAKIEVDLEKSYMYDSKISNAR